MTVILNWRPSAAVSNLHIAWAISENQPIVDPRLDDAVTTSAKELAAEIENSRLPAERFWRHLIPLAAKVPRRRALLETAIAKTIGRSTHSELIASNLEARLAALDLAVTVAIPSMPDDLALRERPLREQWESRGPGMLKRIGELTDDALIAAECDVLLVQPAIGGYGEAHLAYNSARIEAVLANPIAEIPEVVRLTWLVAQLQLDLPTFSESIHAERLPKIARYALLPAALLAAESVELVRNTPALMSQASSAWGLSTAADAGAAVLVAQWWQTYQETRPPFRVALTALDRMVG